MPFREGAAIAICVQILLTGHCKGLHSCRKLSPVCDIVTRHHAGNHSSPQCSRLTRGPRASSTATPCSCCTAAKPWRASRSMSGHVSRWAQAFPACWWRRTHLARWRLLFARPCPRHLIVPCSFRLYSFRQFSSCAVAGGCAEAKAVHCSADLRCRQAAAVLAAASDRAGDGGAAAGRGGSAAAASKAGQ